MKTQKIIRTTLSALLVLFMLAGTVSCKNTDKQTSENSKTFSEVDAKTGSEDENASDSKVSKKKADKKSSENKKSDSSADKKSSSDSVADNKKQTGSQAKTTSKKDTPKQTESTNGNTEDNTDEDEYKFHNYASFTAYDNNTHTAKCKDCGKTVSMEHIWNDGTVATAPTASKSGTLKFTCQICGKTKTQSITYTELKGDGYSSGRKTAETYSAASNRKFEVFGAAYSDGEYCAVYGECPQGLCVMAQSEDGCYAVNSSAGNFALRMKSANDDTKIQYTMWYNGKMVGKPVEKYLSIGYSSYNVDKEWKPMIGYGNLGYFKKIANFANNSQTLDSSKAKKTTDKYTDRVAKLKQISNGEIICVLPPSALSVYAEKNPDKEAYKQDSYLAALSRALTKAGVTVIDLRSTFAAHKNDALPIYNNYDTHWTDYGAYLAYVEIYKHIQQKFPAATPRKFNEFKWTRNYYYDPDIPSYFGVDTKPGTIVTEYGVKRDFAVSVPDVIKNIKRYKNDNSVFYNAYTEQITKDRKYETGRSNLPTTCVIRNSYGAQIYDLIAERSNVSMFNAIFSYKFDTAQYEELKPDYLIYILSEWELDRIVNN